MASRSAFIGETETSVNLTRIRPSRQTGHAVKLLEELGDELFCVGFCGEPIEVGQDFQEGVFSVLDGLGAVVFALRLQAFMMFEKLFAVEIRESGDARWRRLIQRKAWDAGSCPRHIGLIAV